MAELWNVYSRKKANQKPKDTQKTLIYRKIIHPFQKQSVNGQSAIRASLGQDETFQTNLFN